VTGLQGEHLFDLSGRTDDGDDLLDAPLSPEADAALEALRAELAGLASLPYDGP
jgi:hypothetical protein